MKAPVQRTRRTKSKMKMSATKSENQLVEAEEIGGVPPTVLPPPTNNKPTSTGDR